MPFVLLYLVVEIVALVALGSAIGLGWTLLVLLASSVVGLWLARREGVRAAQSFAQAVANRRWAHSELTDGLLVAGAGVLLFVPGLVTDLAGLLLLVPAVRAVVRRRLVRAAEERSPALRTARIVHTGSIIVDGDVATSQEPDARPGGHPVIEGSVVSGSDAR
jgi:UPF0716 protein FxsA